MQLLRKKIELEYETTVIVCKNIKNINMVCDYMREIINVFLFLWQTYSPSNINGTNVTIGDTSIDMKSICGNSMELYKYIIHGNFKNLCNLYCTNVAGNNDALNDFHELLIRCNNFIVHFE